ncbi:spermatogenesis-associated protein 7 homolog [Sphaeramia orbicularis]|uniref:spermatogenesis-associated protein 7 homolog n=1 Tax=Sphaeramia orbicularis TaxID=375764 RepID=UPI00117E5EBB|nr:spermatogenesis-associated protein 7 [Sphaeramia orbicularis]
MGYIESNTTMESRIALGSVSSGSGCSLGMRGKSLKSSPFCPRSSSKLTQSIIKDHMVSHYKKVYSAKAAIDASVPKSLIHSVKYNDQLRQERLRKGVRPQSAHSLSQRNSRASCSSAQSRLSLQYDDSPYLGSRSSVVSSPRFTTSFHAKKVVYPSFKGDSQKPFHRSASEIKYRSPEATPHRKQSTYSLETSGDHNYFKTFQDPVQKTYSGDLLQKHSQHFTQEKPFTPKTLKSEKSSYLSQYRYYRAPRKKPTQDTETFHRSTKTKEYSRDLDERSQGITTDHEWSEDDVTGTYLSASRQHSQANKSREHAFYDSLSRVSPEHKKSPIMKNISAEEEELMYLEFITAVTEDILSRGHISDRVLDRVINRHIDMNRYQLDEGKMRHLLDVLRKEFEEPSNMSSSSPKHEKKENYLLDSLLPQLGSLKELKTKEDNDHFSYASLIKNCESPDYADPLLFSTPLCSPGRTVSTTKYNEKEGEDVSLEKGTVSPSLSGSDKAGFSEEDLHRDEKGTSVTNKDTSALDQEYTVIPSDEGFHQDQAEASYDQQTKELEDLGRNLSESLHVSDNTHCNDNIETANEHQTSAAAVISDDEF